MKYPIIISALLLSCSCSNAREGVCNATYSKQDSVKCEDILSLHFDSPTVKTTDIAKLFLGTPYQGGTLDRDTTEKIVVRLDSLDCTTFVETVTAITKCIKSEKNSFTEYVKALEEIRYRDGICNGYTSRLHYFSEWILNNQEMGIVEEIYIDNATITEERTINFMGCNADKYPGIRNDSDLAQIKAIERAFSAYPFNYIPKDKVAEIEAENIKEGDIIAIVTDIEGLDISHVGFATYVNGEVHLLHASSGKKEVVIDPLSLSDYLARYKHHKGIKVIRLML